MQDYLFARKQVVQTGNYTSSTKFLTHGVPQGSSLSIILCLIYVNDCLNLSFHEHIQMYADDTVLIYSCNDHQQLHYEMQTDLELINNWMYNNYMCLNASKTVYILFRRKRQKGKQPPAIYINGSPIEKTSEAKYTKDL